MLLKPAPSILSKVLVVDQSLSGDSSPGLILGNIPF
jgi:hypothetical protein